MNETKPVAIRYLEQYYKIKNIWEVDQDEIWNPDIAPSFCLGRDEEVTGLNLFYYHIADLSPLAALTRLTKLNLENNKITDLSPLASLTKLMRLDLDNNQIADLSPIASLTDLMELYLSGNQITDLSPLTTLIRLTKLDLESNQIADLSPLATLTRLIELKLEENQIMDISPLAKLTGLTELYLRGNQITDLSPLATLTKLKELWLQISQITDLSPLLPLIPEKSLKNLRLENNQIKTFPPEFLQLDIPVRWGLDSQKGIFLRGNPLESPPIEIVKQGNDAIRNYFEELKQDQVLLLESKLLVVGNGEVGKTTLMKKLLNNNFQVEIGKEDTTRGINITPWKLQCNFQGEYQSSVSVSDRSTEFQGPQSVSEKTVKLHFWDFGGQEILHATHQFFLTKRSLYLFVWEARKDDETQAFDYWLNIIRLLSASSPVIMVMNKSELRTKPIAESAFQEKFTNIKDFIKVSCVTGQNIPELTRIIQSELSQMPHLLDKLPKRWIDIRNRLTNRTENYIDIDAYLDICAAHDMDTEKALFLSDYLHDLGAILHFQRDAELYHTVILKPEWATRAVYALIDSLPIQESCGKFSRSDLHKYWQAPCYPSDKYSLLLRLMENFELCFKIADRDEYILPELLLAERRDIDFKAFHSPQNLHLQYSYQFMPAGILTRFICRVHYLIWDEHYWKNGVELAFYNSSALVESDSIQKRIRISVSGKSPLQLMAIIRSHLDHIHDSLNMTKGEHVHEEIPCICPECNQSDKPHLFKYNALLKRQSKGGNAVCDKSGEDVAVELLLNGLNPPQKTGNLFQTFITIVSQVQGISKAIQPDENDRNSIVALLLQTKGFRVKDQTLWSHSLKGKDFGELDIKIEDDDGRLVSIIEALNLSCLDTGRINSHILKLFKYDCNGVEGNYLLAYVSVQQFEEFSTKYKAHIESLAYGKYRLTRPIEKEETGFQKIIAYRSVHKCNHGETSIHHILVPMGKEV